MVPLTLGNLRYMYISREVHLSGGRSFRGCSKPFFPRSRFERAADLLEDQLEKISDESCPLCSSTAVGGLIGFGGVSGLRVRVKI